MKLILWSLDLPWHVLGLLGVIVCCFWSAALARRLQRRTDLQRWQAFTAAMEEGR